MKRHNSTLGFTVLELVMVILVITILVALLVPSLWRGRDSARITQGLANARGHAQILTAYSQDSREFFPWFMRLDVEHTIVRSEISGIADSGRYFDSQGLWNIALADQYYEGRPDHPSMWNPRVRASRGNIGYIYPASFVSSPEWWNHATRQEAPAQFRGVRAAEVLYPAQKVLVSSHALPLPGADDQVHFLPDATAMLALTDGHATLLRSADAVPAFSPIDGAPPRYTSYWRHFIGQFTQDGVRGRDIK